MSSFLRRPEPAPKAAIRLELAEFNAALDAVHELHADPVCTMMQTLNDLYGILSAATNDAGVIECLDNRQALTSAGVQAALDDLGAWTPGIAAKHMRVLKRARDLLAATEGDSEPSPLVSERVLAAVLRVPIGRLLKDGKHYRLTPNELDSVGRIASLFKEMDSIDGELTRRLTLRTPGQPWATL